MDYVAGRFREAHESVPGLQANFLFGTDQDRGPEPAELTIEFVRRLPFVWPNVNIPTPYGATPIFDRYLAGGRILRGMPLACYCAPYLATTLLHYDPVTYYRHLVRIQQAITSRAALVCSVAAKAPPAVRFAHLVQTLSFREQARETHVVDRSELLGSGHRHQTHGLLRDAEARAHPLAGPGHTRSRHRRGEGNREVLEPRRRHSPARDEQIPYGGA